MTRRTRIHIGVGDILQLIGIAGAAVAVAHLAGLWWGVLLAAVFVVVEANLNYGEKFLTVSLPNKYDLIRARFKATRPVRELKGLGSAALAKVRS